MFFESEKMLVLRTRYYRMVRVRTVRTFNVYKVQYEVCIRTYWVSYWVLGTGYVLGTGAQTRYKSTCYIGTDVRCGKENVLKMY